MPNGRYRVLASRFAAGKPLGNFRYYGTRPDDPNDIVPHEHRRELRGARVFGAWLNHDDSRGVNSLDMLTTEGDRNYVKHYMFDFGSIMGSGTVFAQRHRAGNEYIFESRPGWLTLATLGLYTRPWLHYTIRTCRRRSAGSRATPSIPRSGSPNTRTRRSTTCGADDAFWAARIVSRFSDETIRAIVEKARYTDPRATDYITATLIKRRDKVLKTWLAGVNPLVDFALSDGGELTFANAAVDAGAGADPGGYRAVWSSFDNLTRESKQIGETTGTGTRLRAPAGLPSAPNAFIKIEIAADRRPAGVLEDAGAGVFLRGRDRHGSWWAWSGEKNRPRFCSGLLKRLLQTLVHGIEHLDSGEVLVVRFDERPRREVRARALDHLVHRARVVVPAFAVAPVLLGELPALERGPLTILEAAQLLVGRDVQPELHEHDAVIGELLLERVDLVVGALPLRWRRESLDALDQHAAVPAAVENRDHARARQMPPEAPEVVMGALFVGRRGDGHHA